MIMINVDLYLRIGVLSEHILPKIYFLSGSLDPYLQISHGACILVSMENAIVLPRLAIFLEESMEFLSCE